MAGVPIKMGKLVMETDTLRRQHDDSSEGQPREGEGRKGLCFYKPRNAKDGQEVTRSSERGLE